MPISQKFTLPLRLNDLSDFFHVSRTEKLNECEQSYLGMYVVTWTVAVYLCDSRSKRKKFEPSSTIYRLSMSHETVRTLQLYVVLVIVVCDSTRNQYFNFTIRDWKTVPFFVVLSSIVNHKIVHFICFIWRGELLFALNNKDFKL